MPATLPLPARDVPPRPPEVLVLTACPWTARAVDATLREVGLNAAHLRDPDGAVARLGWGAPDAVIVDDSRWTLGRVGGEARDCIELLGALGAPPDVPVLVLARETPSGARVEALLAAGAWGVVPFPLGAPAWVAQLRVWTRAGAAARQRAEAGLVDAVTGLYNARGVERRALEIEAAVRRGSGAGALACAAFSIETGAAADDGAAIRVADACRRVGRGSDVFGRLGGSEFVVIAPGADAPGVRAVVSRVADAVAADPAEVRVSVRVHATSKADGATAGVASFLEHAIADR